MLRQLSQFGVVLRTICASRTNISLHSNMLPVEHAQVRVRFDPCHTMWIRFGTQSSSSLVDLLGSVNRIHGSFCNSCERPAE